MGAGAAHALSWPLARRVQLLAAEQDMTRHATVDDSATPNM
jgi:hypothetical protein